MEGLNANNLHENTVNGTHVETQEAVQTTLQILPYGGIGFNLANCKRFSAKEAEKCFDFGIKHKNQQR